MKLTEKQSEALDILLIYTNVLLYGGARSGKTALAIYFCIYCALQFPGIRILVVRRYATDVRGSIWNDTLPKILRLLGLILGKEWKPNEQQMTVTFPNSSEIICAGLDDKERVDKILGTEYGIVYVNESQDVPYQTVKTLKTRLAQKTEGFKNRFICDLNPTSIAHWTYKIWFEGVTPDDGKPVAGKYGKIQMNPKDNMENLAEGFIDEQLGMLTGNERMRFLLGEYASNSDLQVFVPKSVHDNDEGFLEWAQGNWRQMQVTGALDLGFEDADAFVMLAYVDGKPDIWLIEEYKGNKDDISTLARNLKKTMQGCWDKYPFSASAKEDFTIWTDTGGLGRKTAVELSEAFELPIRAAYKRDKDVGLFFVQDDVNYGRLHIYREGYFADECKKIVWQRDNETGKILNVLDDDAYHPDIMDAIIYAYRFLMNQGNEAMMGRTVEEIKDQGSKNYFDIEAEVMKALGQAEAVW